MATNIVNDEDTDDEYDHEIRRNAINRGVNIIPLRNNQSNINSARMIRDEQRDARLRGVNVIEPERGGFKGKSVKKKRKRKSIKKKLVKRKTKRK
jgi:hypothetical protein